MTPGAEVKLHTPPTLVSVPCVGSTSVAVVTVSVSPSGSVSLANRVSGVATPGAAACVSFTASGASLTGTIVSVSVDVSVSGFTAALSLTV